ATTTAGITDLKAAPVRLETRTAGSTVSTTSIIRTLRDTLTIHHRRRANHYAAYDLAA
ncbi:hypothetical protein SAMN05421541_13744, partial [Actinoplanes philippinensis]